MVLYLKNRKLCFTGAALGTLLIGFGIYQMRKDKAYPPVTDPPARTWTDPAMAGVMETEGYRELCHRFDSFRQSEITPEQRKWLDSLDRTEFIDLLNAKFGADNVRIVRKVADDPSSDHKYLFLRDLADEVAGAEESFYWQNIPD